MGDFPMLGGQRTENAGAVASASRGTVVTAGGSAHTKGSYSELIASIAFPAKGILVMLQELSAGNDYLIDIAIGAASSEVVICPNLIGGAGTGSISYGAIYYFPIAIPDGTRISARCQATNASVSARVSCILFGKGFMPSEPLSLVEAHGAAVADSGGVSIDPGGTANTKGSYTEIVASTTYPIKALIIGVGNQANNVRSSQSWLVDIAIGAAGSEQVVIPNYAINCSTSPDTVLPQTSPLLPVDIPAGTRLSARAQSDGIDATDRLFDLILYGVS